MEPGVFAQWAHHGPVGCSAFNRVQADEAGGVLWSHLLSLLWAVLPAEGTVRQEITGDASTLHGTREMESAVAAHLLAGDGGPALATHEADHLGCLLDCTSNIFREKSHLSFLFGPFRMDLIGKKQAKAMGTDPSML